MVDIYVGPNKRHWSLHLNLLTHHSTYFESQFSKASEMEHEPPNNKKKQTPSGNLKLDLPEADPTAFELLVKWLYQGRIDDVSDMPVDKKWDYADACQKLYVLCTTLHLPQLKNFAIDQFRKGCNQAGLVPGPEETKAIYDTTAPESSFRKLVSKIAARQIMDPESENDAGTYRMCFEGSPDFAVDVINALRVGVGPKLLDDPTEEGGCTYHEHENGQLCEDSKNGKKERRMNGKPR
ncbi:MAG: hypothetical protein MMC33_005963 [Icmadophila ericetorum]|nr:hypothetical protein [Icmadophila ericetorum]